MNENQLARLLVEAMSSSSNIVVGSASEVKPDGTVNVFSNDGTINAIAIGYISSGPSCIVVKDGNTWYAIASDKPQLIQENVARSRHYKASLPNTVREYIGFLKQRSDEYFYELSFVSIASNSVIKAKNINVGYSYNGISLVDTPTGGFDYRSIVYDSQNNKIYYFFIDSFGLIFDYRGEVLNAASDAGNLVVKCIIVNTQTKAGEIKTFNLSMTKLIDGQPRPHEYYKGFPIYYLGAKGFITKYLTSNGELRFAAFAGSSDRVDNGILCWDLGSLDTATTSINNPAFVFIPDPTPDSNSYYGFQMAQLLNAWGVKGGVVLGTSLGRLFVSEEQISGTDLTKINSLQILENSTFVLNTDTRFLSFPVALHGYAGFLLPIDLKTDKNKVYFEPLKV